MTRSLFLSSAIAALAFSAGAIDSRPGIFDPAFRSLKVTNVDNFFASPIIVLVDPNDAIEISFDCIGDDSLYLRYRLLHCNADWQPSNLVDAEFLDAFNDIPIYDFDFSVATFEHYVNYKILISADKVPITASGNYLLQVYPENEPDDIILQARFSVEQPAVEIHASADAHTDRGVNDIFQQLEISVDADRADLRDPFNDLYITIEQNYAPQAVTIINHPQRVEASKVIYSHLPELIFRAGNEYLRFETVNLLSPGMNVDSIRTIDSRYHAFLRNDYPRAIREYQYDQTQNGKFIIRDYNSSQPDLAADYVTVHFSLNSPEIIDADVYVDGEFNAGRLDSFNRMTYDPQKNAYTAEIPLKQGSYNYRYVVYANGNADPYFIDGDKFETRNEYTIKAFIRTPGQKADRLVGHSSVTAFQ